MSYIVFDIETGPLDLEKLKEQMPAFEAAANLKDPEKIKAAIESKQEKWISDAALSAETGKILAIGYKTRNNEAMACFGPEDTLLKQFWSFYSQLGSETEFVGHNIIGFDWPFIVRRSWALGVSFPKSALQINRFRPFPLYDTAQAWDVMGQKDHISLDRLARFLGVGKKSGSGADFAKLLESNKDKAIQYLTNDLLLTEAVYLKLVDYQEEDDCPL